ncbi:MAG: hypothetical protein ABSH35_04695 [Isosphaeraceae bacterium]|jgi:hypothetical protein
MKRVFLLAAVVMVASTWARPARAQLGLLNLGTGTGVGTPLDSQKNLVKKKQSTSLPPPPVAGSTRARSSRSALTHPGMDDHRFGRIDMAGHPISGYPAIRGEVSGPNASRVSRGGANGQGGKVIRRK